MGTNYYAVKNKPTVLSPIHIGKSSMGWKFCFHRVCSFENYINEDPLNTFVNYDLWESDKWGKLDICTRCFDKMCIYIKTRSDDYD